jgi:hypothetical protein
LTGELDFPDTRARSIVLQSVAVAQDCINAQSKRAHQLEAHQAPTRICSTCCRISKCIRRAPAVLRHRLDEKIPALINDCESDLETIEAVFAATRAIFEDQKFCKSESSRTALEALKAPCAADYSTLDVVARGKVMAALAKLVSSGRQVKAADVFAVVAAVLDNEKSPKISAQSRDLRTRYVADLKTIWLKAGLKPSRSLAYLDDTYRSRFHRFAELVYVAMAAPWAFRHESRYSLAKQRPCPSLERADYKWEISDDHVRNGLTPSFKF